MYTLLATAWTYDHQATVSTVSDPMQPGRFEITCDARVVQNVLWTTFCMKGKLCKPKPSRTFDATVNWAFESLNLYSASRLQGLNRCQSAHASRFREAMIFRTDRSIKRAFSVARDTSWSLEQTFVITDRIPEKYHPLCLSEDEYDDLRLEVRSLNHVILTID